MHLPPLEYKMMLLGRIIPLISLLAAVRAEGITFPTEQQDEFIVGDLVNVTWDVITARISLYEVCDSAIPLELNVTNTYSYVWNATRDNYRESGCAFELQPLGPYGTPNPPNLTSFLFGVSKRYAGDPSPVFYNFANMTTSSNTTTSVTSTPSSASSFTTSTSILPTVAAVTSDPIATPTAVVRSSLGTAQTVGIGLGVPLGVLTIFLAGVLA